MGQVDSYQSRDQKDKTHGDEAERYERLEPLKEVIAPS
jgi:hypothetical protein